MTNGSVEKILDKFDSNFYRLVESSQDIFWIRSEDLQQQLYISPAFEKIFGYSCASLYQNPASWVDSVIIEDRDRVRQILMEWQSNSGQNKSNIAEYRIKNRQGKTRWIRESCFPLMNNNQCVAYAGVAKDITPEVMAAEEREGVLRYFRYFAGRHNMAYWLRDKNGNAIYLSSGFEKILNVSRQDAYDNPKLIKQLTIKEDRNDLSFVDSFKSLLQGDNNQTEEKRYRIKTDKKGVRWIRDRRFLVKDEETGFFALAGVTEDITRDALREAELREAKETAEKANRAKSDFMAMMSHELRTPLNAILGMTQTLNLMDLKEEVSGHVDVINEAGHRLLAMVRDILDYAKLERGQLNFVIESVELKTLVESIFNDLALQATNKGVDFQLRYDEDNPNHINCDEKRLRQILVNLLTNAIKFTEKGHIKLKVTTLQKNSKEVTLCFTVEDTGIGIAEEKLKSIFNRFEQVDSIYHRKHEGVGLGLAIVKELVEKMGGSIAVSSEENAGSQFSCIVPFGLQSAKVTTISQPEQKKRFPVISHNHQENKEHFAMDILVVEDNLINQRVARSFLEQVGCRVTIAADGHKALDSFKEKNDYDLIFMDIGLPTMSGFETTQAIREQEAEHRHVPIVAMTAHVFAQDREKCMDAGMDDVLPKPIMRKDLIATLKQWTCDKVAA